MPAPAERQRSARERRSPGPRPASSARSSSACGTETLGADLLRVITRVEEQIGGVIEETVRAADERGAAVDSSLGDLFGVDVAAVSAPPLRGVAGEGEQRLVARLVLVDDVIGVANGVDEAHRQVRHRPPPVTQHAHQGDDTRATTDEQYRLLPVPDEVGGERAADLYLVALDDHVVEVGRDLAVL